MAPIQDFARHSNLLQKMANRLGVDLGQAVLDGKLRNFPFEDMVYRCSKCAQTSACEAWLEMNAGGATETPDFCRNKALIEALRH